MATMQSMEVGIKNQPEGGSCLISVLRDGASIAALIRAISGPVTAVSNPDAEKSTKARINVHSKHSHPRGVYRRTGSSS
jgi:hypothetical protein